MVRILKREPQNDDIHYVELAGLSTDDKPTMFATGSLFLEVDTGIWWAFDEEGLEWNPIAGGSSDSSSNSSSANALSNSSAPTLSVPTLAVPSVVDSGGDDA